MKNKKMTYFLGFVVIIVWGIIIYRLFDAAGGSDDDVVPAVSINSPKEPYNDFEIPKDTTHLLLNYRNPFGLVKQKDTSEISLKRSVHTSIIPIPVKPIFNWGFIQYSGYVRNPGSQKLITLVSINGQNEMLTEGEMKNQVKLIKNLGDSIKISFNGKTKFITMKHAAL